MRPTMKKEKKQNSSPVEKWTIVIEKWRNQNGQETWKYI